MKVRQILEDFYNEYKAPLYLGHFNSFPVFKEPSKKEMEEVIKSSSHLALRFIADSAKKDLYVFSSDVMHELVTKKIYDSKPKLLLFGMAEKEDGELKAQFGQAWGTQLKSGTNYYEAILKEDWEWLNKYFNMAPLFLTVMRRYKGQ